MWKEFKEFAVRGNAVDLAVKREPLPTPPSTKECPYCISSIAIKATRCPQCTSELQAA